MWLEEITRYRHESFTGDPAAQISDIFQHSSVEKEVAMRDLNVRVASAAAAPSPPAAFRQQQLRVYSVRLSRKRGVP